MFQLHFCQRQDDTGVPSRCRLECLEAWSWNGLKARPSQDRVTEAVGIVVIVAVPIEIAVIISSVVAPRAREVAPGIRVARRVAGFVGVVWTGRIAGDVGITDDSTVIAVVVPAALLVAWR